MEKERHLTPCFCLHYRNNMQHCWIQVAKWYFVCFSRFQVLNENVSIKRHLTPVPVCTSISLTAYSRLSETETLLTRVVITSGFWVVIYFSFGVVISIPSVGSFFNQQNPDIPHIKRLRQRYWYTLLKTLTHSLSKRVYHCFVLKVFDASTNSA